VIHFINFIQFTSFTYYIVSTLIYILHLQYTSLGSQPCTSYTIYIAILGFENGDFSFPSLYKLHSPQFTSPYRLYIDTYKNITSTYFKILQLNESCNDSNRHISFPLNPTLVGHESQSCGSMKFNCQNGVFIRLCTNVHSFFFKIFKHLWVCFLHGFLVLPCNIFRIVTSTLKLYQISFFVPKHLYFLVHDAHWFHPKIPFMFHLNHILINHVIRIRYILF